MLQPKNILKTNYHQNLLILIKQNYLGQTWINKVVFFLDDQQIKIYMIIFGSRIPGDLQLRLKRILRIGGRLIFGIAGTF